MLALKKQEEIQGVQSTPLTAPFWEAILEQLPTASSVRARQKARNAGAYCSEEVGLQCAHNFGCSQSIPELIEALDHLSDSIRGCEIGLYEELGFSGNAPDKSLSLHHLADAPSIPLHYVGSGHHGSVYRIESPEGSSYALKVFYRRDSERDFSGPYSEAALGAYVTHKQVADMPWLCLAHPEHGWILSEFVDENYRSKNPGGPGWSSLGLINMDHQRDESNTIQTKRGYQFRVDYGHLKTEEQEESAGALRKHLLAVVTSRESISKEDFVKLYEEHPDARHDLADALFLVEAADRLHVLEQLYTYPEMQHYPIQDYLKAGVFLPEQTIHLFQMLMQHPNEMVRSQAIFDLRDLSQEDQQYLKEEWKQGADFSQFMDYCAAMNKQ